MYKASPASQARGAAEAVAPNKKKGTENESKKRRKQKQLHRESGDCKKSYAGSSQKRAKKTKS